jgi:hypothetical protein
MQNHQLNTSHRVELNGTNRVANLVKLSVNSDEIVGNTESSGEEESHAQGESGKVH